MARPHVLIADPDMSLLESCRRVLAREDFVVVLEPALPWGGGGGRRDPGEDGGAAEVPPRPRRLKFVGYSKKRQAAGSPEQTFSEQKESEEDDVDHFDAGNDH